MTEADFYPWWLQDQESETLSTLSPHHYVHLIFLNRNGARWQNEALSAIGSQSRRPDSLIAVDCGSNDDSAIGLTDVFELKKLPDGLAFGEYVNQTVDALPVHAEKIEWLWLLHDDSAPHSHSLKELLLAADSNPQAVVFGSKVLDWRNPEHVLEIGSSITGIGTRFTGLEHGERDQGQHDQIEKALVVSSAGMLIRRDVWVALGGFTTTLPHFRVDAEFCFRVWESGNEVLAVGKSRIRHVAATARDIRKPAKERSSSHYVDRRAGMLLLLSRTPRKIIWFRFILLFLAGVARGAGYLLLQDLKGARDEWRATASLIFNPIPIQKLRNHCGQLNLPSNLKPSLRLQLQHLSTELGNGISQTWNRVLNLLFPKIDSTEVGKKQAAFAILRRPGTVLSILTILIGLYLSRSVVGAGQLATYAGSMPTSALAMWNDFVRDLHPVGMGSTEPSHPFIGFWAFLSAALFTSPALLAERLLIFGPWLAALSMHLGLRTLIRHAPTRVWLAALYGLSPALLIATRMGDVAVVLLAILLPGFLYGLTKPLTWRLVGLLSLGFSLFVMVWPAFWLVGAVLLLVYVLRKKPPTEFLKFAGFGLFAPLGMLAPWSFQLFTDFEVWFNQFGHSGETISVWRAVFGNGITQSGFGWWWQLPIFIVALMSIIDRRHSSLHVRIWILFSTLIGVGLFSQLIGVVFGLGEYPAAFSALAVVLFGLIIISLASATTFVSLQLQRSDFGWRQISAVALVIGISVLPIAAIANTEKLPTEFQARKNVETTAEMLRGFTEDLRLRTLFLKTKPDGTIQAQIMDSRPILFGDSETIANDTSSVVADRILAWLTQGATESGNPLFDLGIGYIASPYTDEVETLISSRGNLDRLITARSDKLLNVWRLIDVQARTYIVSKSGSVLALGQFDVESASLRVSGVAQVDEKSRILQIAERPNSAWVATLNGVELKPVARDVQSWLLPANADGEIEIEYASDIRFSILLISWFVIGIAVVFIAPRRRHIYRDEWMAE